MLFMANKLETCNSKDKIHFEKNTDNGVGTGL